MRGVLLFLAFAGCGRVVQCDSYASLYCDTAIECVGAFVSRAECFDRSAEAMAVGRFSADECAAFEEKLRRMTCDEFFADRCAAGDEWFLTKTRVFCSVR
jgi:hypothetical protein